MLIGVRNKEKPTIFSIKNESIHFRNVFEVLTV